MSPPTLSLSHSLSFTWALSLSHTHSLSNIPSFSNILTDNSVSISTAKTDKEASAILAIFTLQKPGVELNIDSPCVY